MRRNIPSLAALMALESAGRLRSFSRAAEELGVTQGAISRQVRALELELRAPLFDRSSFGVELTPTAHSYIEVVRACLAELEAATDGMRAHRDSAALRIAVPPTFAARWLVPKLADFVSSHAGMSVDLSVRAIPLPAIDRSLDGEIIFAETAPPRFDVAHLLQTCLVPVCAPALAGSGTAETELLELGKGNDWAAYHAAFPHERLATARPYAFAYFDAGIHAAVLGRGILLSHPFLISNELRSGSLVIYAATALRRPGGYFFRTHSKRYEAAAAIFVDWLRAELQRTSLESLASLGPLVVGAW